MGEYPFAEFVPAHKSNYRVAARSTYERIVIHISSGHPDARPVAEMWQQPNHGTSAHFVIGQDGTVLQCVSLKDIAEHAHAANATSVGIEHCAREPGEFGALDGGLPPSPLQLEKSAKLVAWLCIAAGLDIDRVTIQGHSEVDAQTTHSGCPNSVWRWGEYIALVRAERDRIVGATFA